MYCFLCIKNIIREGAVKCPTCDQFIMDDLSKVKLLTVGANDNIDTTILWLYSATFKNKWWCYDIVIARQLEEQFVSYKEKKHNRRNLSMSNENFDIVLGPNSDVSVVAAVSDAAVSYHVDKSANYPICANQGPIAYPDSVKQRLSNNNKENTGAFSTINHDYCMIQTHNPFCGNTDKQFSMIKYGMHQNDEQRLSPIQLRHAEKPSHTCKIKIADDTYIIDFNRLYQMNDADNSKKRRIKRIEVPKGTRDIYKFLQEKHNVVGVTGIKF